MTNTFFKNLITTSALTILLTACGGGGGSLLSGQSVNLNGTGNNVGGTPTPNPTPTTPPNNPANLTARNINDFLTSNEYNRTSSSGGSTGLAQINAAPAYALGATGAGITIAVIDTGIDMNNAEFAGAISDKSINIVNGLKTVSALGGSTNPHGTWVSGVLGARMNSDLTMGVAWGSTLMAIRADTLDGNGHAVFQAQNIASSLRYAADNNAKIVNMSFGANGSLGSMVTDAAKYAVTKGLLLVAAAGNEGNAQVDSPANLGNTTGIAGSILAVGAVDSNNVITSFSNRAGLAKDYYLVAPGMNILTTDTPNGMALTAGTSFAAPMVSGAAALLMEYAPYLTGKQVASILLNTATDLGATGVDDIYGHGLLNIGAAVSPVGLTTIPTAGTSGGSAQSASAAAATGHSASTSSTYVAMSAAFGDAMNNNSLLKKCIMLDSYGRAFGFDMSSRVSRASYTSNMSSFIASRDNVTSTVIGFGENGMASFGFTAANNAHQVQDLKDKGRINGDTRMALTTKANDTTTVSYAHGQSLAQSFGFAENSSRAATTTSNGDMFDNAFLGLVNGGNSAATAIDLGHGLALNVGGGMEDGQASFTSDSNKSGSRSGYAAELTYKQGKFKLGLQAGQVTEGESSLSSQSDGALAFGQGSKTNFVALNATIPLMQGLALAGTYQVGMTQIGNSATSILSDFRNVKSDKFALALMADDVMKKGDHMVLAVSQPLRVNGGSAMLTVPTSVESDGTIINSSQRVGLTPSGRQTDLSVGYNFAMDKKQTLGIAAVSSLNPGNDSKADTAYAIGVRYTKVF